jgi:uncharacterized protein YqjF (DUF2071 family)
LHYKVPGKPLLELLPEGLGLDTYDQEAWISVVAFTVKNMRLKYVPPLPYLSRFNEVNLRTYVIKDGKPGIYFISIETNKIPVALMANILIGLDYKKAKVKRSMNRYRVKKSEENNFLDMKYLSLTAIHEKTPLETWLTERYCAYEKINNRLYRFNIHHLPWTLKNIKVRSLTINYSKDNLAVRSIVPDLRHFSPLQKVLLWGRERCKYRQK